MRSTRFLLLSVLCSLQGPTLGLKVFTRNARSAMTNKSAAATEELVVAKERRMENRNPLSIEGHILTAARRGAIENFQSKMVPEEPNPDTKHNPLWVEEYVYTGERRGPEMPTNRRR